MAPCDPFRARFPGQRAGYESYYLRAADPVGTRGFWVRYTVHRRRGDDPRASLWFTYFDAEAPGPTAVKATTDDPSEGSGAWIRIGDATAGPGGARGGVAVPGKPAVGWDLTFAGDGPFPHLPQPWMYGAPLPRTKPVSLHPTAAFGGALTIGDRTVPVDGWRGMVGHNWGSQHAERWIWLHGTGLGGDPGAWLDVVLARLRLGPWTTPWSGFGGLYLEGRCHRLGGLSRGRSTHVDEHPDRLAFSLSGKGLAVRGRVAAPPERFVGWVYADPDGATHDVVHCSIADLEITLAQPDRPPRRLHAAGAAYELGMREHDHGVPLQPFGDG